MVLDPSGLESAFRQAIVRSYSRLRTPVPQIFSRERHCMKFFDYMRRAGALMKHFDCNPKTELS